MSVAMAQREISSKEFSEWCAYFRLRRRPPKEDPNVVRERLRMKLLAMKRAKNG
jgi:hypothetical protein